VVKVEGMFDPVTMLRTLSEADLQRAEEAAVAAAGGVTTPRASSIPGSDDAERLIMTPNVYGPSLLRRCAAQHSVARSH
jgi:hypothetical protein